MRMRELIRESWGWAGFEDVREVLAQNQFGNLIFRDSVGCLWRICPEQLSCEKIAEDDQEYARLWKNEAFLRDWNMEALVETANARYGAQPQGRCFCLKMPAALGGGYEVDNVGTIAIAELISFAGDIAKQIKDLPDGAKIRLRFVKGSA
jgi:hypothetical protein